MPQQPSLLSTRLKCNLLRHHNRLLSMMLSHNAPHHHQLVKSPTTRPRTPPRLWTHRMKPSRRPSPKIPWFLPHLERPRLKSRRARQKSQRRPNPPQSSDLPKLPQLVFPWRKEPTKTRVKLPHRPARDHRLCPPAQEMFAKVSCLQPLANASRLPRAMRKLPPPRPLQDLRRRPSSLTASLVPSRSPSQRHHRQPRARRLPPRAPSSSQAKQWQPS